MRLIDADELAGKLKGLKEHVDKISINRKCRSRCLVDVTQVIEYVENAPTVEAVRLDESCDDCPLYDHDKHNCPRFNKVIPETIAEISAETVQGEWIIDGAYWQHCNKCGVAVNRFAVEQVKASEHENLRFCPNCGARMKGGGSE